MSLSSCCAGRELLQSDVVLPTTTGGGGHPYGKSLIGCNAVCQCAPSLRLLNALNSEDRG